MKKTISALLALTALAAAVPAMAQDYDDRGRGRGYDDRGYDDRRGRDDDRRGGAYGQDLRGRYDAIERRIERGMRDRSISYREADRLRGKLRELKQLDRRYRYSEGRLSRWEMRDLDQRADQLERQVRYERRDGDGRRY